MADLEEVKAENDTSNQDRVEKTEVKTEVGSFQVGANEEGDDLKQIMMGGKKTVWHILGPCLLLQITVI